MPTPTATPAPEPPRPVPAMPTFRRHPVRPAAPRRRAAALLLAAALATGGCDRVLETEPRAALPQSQMIVDAATASAALSGAYEALTRSSLYGRDLLLLGDLPADNATWTGTFQFLGDIGQNRILADNAQITDMWYWLYRQVDRDNVILERVPQVQGMTDAQRNDILGQAHFLRALSFHNLTKFWGAIPLPLAPVKAPDDAAAYTRQPVAQVYTQILADLDRAQTLITNTTNTRQASQTAVRALRARVLLYRASQPGAANAAADWQGALDAANQVLTGRDTLTVAYADLFSPTGTNTTEDIFRVAFNAQQANGLGFYYLQAGRGETMPSANLDAAFGAGDVRRAATLRPTNNANRPFNAQKWSTAQGTEHVHVIRLAEVVLIKAEALARLNRLPEAVRSYNLVRVRAGLAPHAVGREVTSQADVLAAIDRERRLELALEGDRWPDLVRRGVAAQVKGFTDRPGQALLPIPLRDVQTSPGLTQNPGY